MWIFLSLTQLQEIPSKNIVLLVGPPGSGKSTFCRQVTLRELTMEKPIIYVTTECGPSEIDRNLGEMGLGEIKRGLLNYIDAYNQTVGLSISDRSDIVPANSANLSSIGIAIYKQQKKIGKKSVLLIFDSLVSPYLLNGFGVVRFMKLTLSRFAAMGNSVLVCMDEGCSKEEDLGAMKSLSNGILQMMQEEGKRVLNIIKHPTMKSSRLEVPTNKTWETKYLDSKLWDHEMMESSFRFFLGKPWEGLIRKGIEDYVNVFWPNLIFWSSMLWNPKKFSEMIYKLSKEGIPNSIKEMISHLPRNQRLSFNLFMPKSFSNVKDMKKMLLKIGLLSEKSGGSIIATGDGIFEFLEDVSKIDEHYFRVSEYYECWGFRNVGVRMASFLPPTIAGLCKGLEKEERDWNVVETKCIGLGDSYCEFKLVPGEIDGLKSSFEKDVSVVEKINERMMQSLMGFLFHGKPLVDRPRLGSDMHLMGAGPLMGISAMGGESYRIACRMGGVKIGKRIGENLMDVGIEDDKAIKCILNFLKHSKVGEVTIEKAIKIKENCESIWTRFYTTTWEEPGCFFTTGFFNGFFSVVNNQNVRETKCIAMGDPYCEWEFR